MPRTVIHTDQAPKAIGPYSQAVAGPRRDGWSSSPARFPLDPATGELVPGDVGAQTERVMKNLGAVLDRRRALLRPRGPLHHLPDRPRRLRAR